MTFAPQTRWTTEQANAWWQAQPWPMGCNFLPSSAVNFLEMWHEESFDRDTITRELGWAAGMGLNSIRTNLHFLVWKHDRNGLKARFDWFLDTADGLGLSVMPVLFDDCGFGGAEPLYGPQPDPVPGLHNSRAVASPGRAAVMDRGQWPEFQAYLQDMIRQHSRDPRILAWDLYNEPGNRMIFLPGGAYAEYDAALGAHSLALMEHCFDWAREVGPCQPLTVAAWRTPRLGVDAPAFDDPIDRRALALSDIISFHAYCDLDHARRYAAQLAAHGRPLMITEWLARTIDSRIQDQLPFYQAQGIGAYHWGLVKGRTQTDAPWPQALQALHGHVHAPDLWFHDLLWPDGRAYDPAERDVIAHLTETASCAERKRG
ncbi:MAG: 1,4-beta-xylanase [Rhodobacteraceae bacterium]|nr:MAG: 1,4-beta-xylanase [Paracoccaceae bacterium]